MPCTWLKLSGDKELCEGFFDSCWFARLLLKLLSLQTWQLMQWACSRDQI